MTFKQALKEAKEAFRTKSYDDAIANANTALKFDKSSVPALLILARALELNKRQDEAIVAYKKVLKIRDNTPEAWTGLKGIYKSWDKDGVADLIETCISCAGTKIKEFKTTKAEFDLGEELMKQFNEAIDFARQKGTPLQRARTYELVLPSSRFYEHISNRATNPLKTWLNMADFLEKWEKTTINRAMGERRTQIGIRLHDSSQKTKREIMGQSNLSDVYQNIINWAQDDRVRHEYEEKQFARSIDTLDASTPQDRKSASNHVLSLAQGIAVVKYPLEEAWKVCIEWHDGEEVGEWDEEIIRGYIGLFPTSGLAKVLKGYLYSPLAPFPFEVKKKGDNPEEKEKGPNLSDDEVRLGYMTDGLNEAKDSIMAHRLMSKIALYRGEHELATRLARTGLTLTGSLQKRTTIRFQRALNGFNNVIGRSLILHEPPKHHVQAREILSSILKTDPEHFSALSGLGDIAECEELYKDARNYYQKALDSKTDIKVQLSLAWTEAMLGDYDNSLPKLQSQLEQIVGSGEEDRNTRVLTRYRIGRCIWEMNPARKARKDRKGAYSWFLSAIKLDANFAPAYTSLGIFYLDYVNDQRRGRQCFQKAFELSTAETVGAKYLANSFADDSNWDVVELVAQRVIEGGHAAPSSESSRKGLSWPFSALGVVNMNRADFHTAATKFLMALRISPNDYNSYIGLAEAYHNSGRHNSALRTLATASSLENSDAKEAGSWFGRYILGNVNREIGLFEEAIKAYNSVLAERPAEVGVQNALLQTMVEQGFAHIEAGYFNRASEGFVLSLRKATEIGQKKAFNVWKAVGDACFGLTMVETEQAKLVSNLVKPLLQNDFDDSEYSLFTETDRISLADLDTPNIRHRLSIAGVLAYKRAIIISSDSVPSQAAGWFNLGCAQLRLNQTRPGEDKALEMRHMRAAVKCFKRAIELEPGNSDFWAALGSASAFLNAEVSQHSLIRALNINTRSAKAWSFLGSLYLEHGDKELAELAFSRAQSTDPEFSRPWIGLGLCGGKKLGEDLHNYEQALGVSTQDEEVPRRQYVITAFSSLLSGKELNLLLPLFTLQQLASLIPGDAELDQLRAHYLERLGHHAPAAGILTKLGASLEEEFEKTEEDSVLIQFSGVKADVARNMLALRQFESARDMADEVIVLTDDCTPKSDFETEMVQRAQLSAHLTSGLAAYYLDDMSTALDSFRAALQKQEEVGDSSDATADIMCLLSQVLWTQGGADERAVARESVEELLADDVTRLELRPLLMLGVMAYLEQDSAAAAAILSDLVETSAMMEEPNAVAQLDRVSSALRSVVKGKGEEEREGILSDVMMFPFRWTSWADMSTYLENSGDPSMSAHSAHTRQNALIAATSWAHQLRPDKLAVQMSKAPRVEDRQAGVMLAPWMAETWNGLVECLK